MMTNKRGRTPGLAMNGVRDVPDRGQALRFGRAGRAGSLRLRSGSRRAGMSRAPFRRAMPIEPRVANLLISCLIRLCCCLAVRKRQLILSPAMNQSRVALRMSFMVSALRSSVCTLPLLFSIFASPSASAANAGIKPDIATRQLANGIDALVVHFPQSTNVSIYTFSPLSLATDAPHEAQWAHLVEHMVIRTTVPEDAR